MSTMNHIEWQTRAQMAYQWTEGQEIAGMRASLAARIDGLIGRTIAPETIYVDRDAHRATAVVDGVVFRLLRHELVIVKRCAGCGIGHFESSPITSLPDLGYALGAWQPRCKHCPLEDPTDWMDRVDSTAHIA